MYTKRKQRRITLQEPSEEPGTKKTELFSCIYPSSGWSNDLKRMPGFTRAEINLFIWNSGKNSTYTPRIQSNFRKATAFWQDEYLKNIYSNSDDKHFYIKSKCHYTFRKNDPSHELKITLCLLTGNVKHAQCSCVAGKVGFCNHVLALMIKLCKFSLIIYNCVTIDELETEPETLMHLPATAMAS